jgi:hypothetical protein
MEEDRWLGFWDAVLGVLDWNQYSDDRAEAAYESEIDNCLRVAVEQAVDEHLALEGVTDRLRQQLIVDPVLARELGERVIELLTEAR